MKKILMFAVFFVGVSLTSYSQSAGGSGAEKVSGGGRAHRSERKKLKPRKQMRHFDARKPDPNIRYNGTSYRMNKRREQIEAENNGFKGNQKAK